MSSRGSIPGYFFDEAKGRYFPVQPNHIAPKSASYSQSAVNANTQADKLKKVTEQRDDRIKNGRISRSNISTPFLDLRLNNQLGLLRTKPSLTYARGCYYANELSYLTATLPPSRNLIGFFTLNSSLHFSSYYTDPPSSLPTTSYCHSTAVDKPSMWWNLRLSSPPKRIAATVQHYFVLAGGVLRSLLAFIILIDTGDDFYVYNTDFRPPYAWHDKTLSRSTDLSISPDGRKIALPSDLGMTVVHLGPDALFVERRRTLDKRDYMVTSHIDDSTLISGERSGGIHLFDYRVSAHVHRLQHSSAVNGIHARTPNEFIVSGLESAALYDLRYIKDRPEYYHQSYSSPGQDLSSRKKRQPRKNNQVRKYISTQPLVKFRTSPDRFSQYYPDAGKSFAYIPSLDIAVIATHRTSSIQTRDSRDKSPSKADRITLYHVSSGRILPSIFDDMVYDSDILQVGVHRMRDGPESILVCTADKLQEFRVDLSKNEKHHAECTLINDRFPPDAELGMEEQWDKGDLGPL